MAEKMNQERLAREEDERLNARKVKGKKSARGL